MSKPETFWISPEGYIYPLRNKRHLTYVIDHPHLFSFDPERYRSLLKKYHEKWWHDGEVRRLILTEIIKKGWIRVHFTGRPYLYTVETWQFNDTSLSNIKRWIQKGLKENWLYKNTDLRFVEDKTKKSWKRDINEFLQTIVSPTGSD